MIRHLHVPEGTVVPPLRFAAVEPLLYRGSYPRPLNLPFLETLNLKTIISIVPHSLEDNIVKWAAECGIQNIRISPKSSSSKERHLDFYQAKQILEIMIDSRYAPLYIHCLNGGDVTSLAILCLRKLQMWTQSAIFSEMLRFSPIHRSAETFVVEFGSQHEQTVEIPRDKVGWLWQGLLDETGFLSIEKVNMVGTAGKMHYTYQDEDLEKKRLEYIKA